MRRRLSKSRILLLVTLVVPALLGPGTAGCKLEQEPDWPYGPPPGGLPDVGQAGGAALADAGPSSAEDVVGPDAPAPDDVAGVTPGVTPDGGLDAAPDASPDASAEGGPVTLDEDTLVALRSPVAAADREVAERETASGRALHARLQLREALGRYRLALQRMPAHPHANYQAARALALLGQPREAVRHLLALEVIGTDTARGLLAEARGERDFRALWPDATYRRLTGFGTIGVAVVAGDGGPPPGNDALGEQRDALVERLTDAGLPAAPAQAPDGLTTDGAAGTVFHVPEHQDLAQAVARALDDAPIRSAASLPADVLVLWRAETALPASPAVSLDALLDHRLQARDGYGLRLFRLRSTGWFESEDRATDGTEVRRRRGRYQVEGEALALTFDETLERYPDGADVPEIETSKGTRTVPFSVGPGRQLVIDGLAYRPK